jgi:hypothetical protein
MTETKKSANGFSPTTMIGLVLVSVVCLLGIALLSAFEPELKSGNDGAAHGLSKSSVGYSAMAQLLDRAGQKTQFSRRELAQTQARSTLVLAPTLSTEGSQIEDFRHFGPVVILLPKWLGQADQKRRGWIQLVGETPEKQVLDILPEDWREEDATTLNQAEQPQRLALTYRSFVKNAAEEFGTSQTIEALRTISGEMWVPIVAGPSGGAVIVKHKTENVYVVADPDIFNNAGMTHLANARLASHFFGDIKEDANPIVFDLTLNGFQRQPNLGRVAIEPPVLGATLCLMLAAILIGLQAAVRFLPPQPAQRAVALGKRSLADNTAGLIRMGKREHRMALPYANLIKRQVAKAISVPAHLDAVAMTATLDKLSEMSKSNYRFEALAADAGAAASAQDLIKVAGNLYRWKQEMTRERQ